MIQSPQKKAMGRAHSKLILVGEHAVVYGKPAIALPFSALEVKSTVLSSHDEITISSDYYRGTLLEIPDKLQGIRACILATLKSLKLEPKGLHIDICSTIPIGRGLGSSASIAIAIVRSLYAFAGRVVSQQELMKLVHIAETFAHGRPSGIDMVCASSDTPIWFQMEKEVEPIQVGAPLCLIVADTGRIGDTHAAVKGVRDQYEQNQRQTERAINRLADITVDTRIALSNGEISQIGKLLNLAHEELIGLGVSDPGLNHLVDTARIEGSLGAKLTGGGRGGCMLALARDERHAKQLANALSKAGAFATWPFTLNVK